VNWAEEDAARHLRAILASDPHNEDGLCLMAQAQLGQTAYDESLRTSWTAISVNPENEWAHRLASLALSAFGRHPEARAMGRDAVAGRLRLCCRRASNWGHLR